jgi:Tfp pilus assembly protein PilN
MKKPLIGSDSSTPVTLRASELASAEAFSRSGRWTRRHRAWMQAGGMALWLVAITSVGAYFYQRETSEQNRKLAEEKAKLAEEKGKLAEEKGKLASDNLQLAQAAQAQAE